MVDELRRGIERGYSFLKPVLNATEDSEGWLKILVLKSPEESQLLQEINEFLHPGEASCIALAISRNMILVTDDLAARRVASRRNVRLTGTVGILVEMVYSGILSIEDGNALLKEMIDRGYRSPCNCLDEFV